MILVTNCTNQADLERTEKHSSREMKRSSTKAVPGTVKNLLSRFHTEGSVDLEDLEEEAKEKESDKKPRYQRTSTRAAPGTVTSLRANFETK